MPRRPLLLLVVSLVTITVGLAAPAYAQEEVDFFEWDPLGLIAGSEEFHLHSLGEDRWEVWVCDLPAGDVALNAAALAAVLNAEAGPFFDWLSEGRYLPTFSPGGSVQGADLQECSDEVHRSSTGSANGAFLVHDLPLGGGWTSVTWCPLTHLFCSIEPTFPANRREIHVGAMAVTGPEPRFDVVHHELGHSLFWPHSGFEGEYDNPVDLMSGSRGRIIGTLAINRYAAGWLDPSRVEVHAGGNAELELSPIGRAGTQLLILPGGNAGTFTTVEAVGGGGYDLAQAKPGVALHRVDQGPQACATSQPYCAGTSRDHRATRQNADDAHSHVLEVGETAAIGDLELHVVARHEGRYKIRISGPGAAPSGVPVELSIDLGFFDPLRGEWHLLYRNGETESFHFGLPGDVPLIGDWNCDGVDTVGMFRPADGFVYLRNSNTLGVADDEFFYGVAGDKPVVGDWNGDGCDTLAIHRDGEVFVRNRLGTGPADFTFSFGVAGDLPFAGDFNGDGKSSVGLYRASTGYAYLRESLTSGLADIEFFFGAPGDRITAGDWDGSGYDTLGAFRPLTRRVYLANQNGRGGADIEFSSGEREWHLLAGELGG